MFSFQDPQPERTYTLQTPGLLIKGNPGPVNSFLYKPAHAYSIETFEAINDWLKTKSLEIDGDPINHFERDSEGRIFAMPQTPIKKEAAVTEIARQLANWNIALRRTGWSLPPKATYSVLTQEQRLSFKGAPFSPVFVVEVDDLTNRDPLKLDSLTKKIKETYFPSGVQLAWLVDATNQIFFSFSTTFAGVVQRYPCQWLDEDDKPTVVQGGDVLPGFRLELSRIDNAISPANVVSMGNRFTCPKCDKTFVAKYNFMQHFEDDH